MACRRSAASLAVLALVALPLASVALPRAAADHVGTGNEVVWASDDVFYCSSCPQMAGRMYSVHGLDLDSAGNLYVADHALEMISKFSPSGDYVTHITLDNVFPAGLAVSDGGEIYVGDAFNKAIMVFDASLGVLRQWSTGTSGPTDLAVDSGANVYVIQNGLVVKYSLVGDALGQWSVPGAGAIAIDGKDRVYVAVPGAVWRYSSLGVPQLTFPADCDLRTRMKASPDGVLYCRGGRRYTQDGLALGTFDMQLGQFIREDSIAVDVSGNVYVAGAEPNEHPQPAFLKKYGPIIPDFDHDTIQNFGDNCPTVVNRNQRNLDRDAWGDVCDSDDDGDGHHDVYLGDGPADNCAAKANANQATRDGDGLGNACDADDDGDGFDDATDLCPFLPTPDNLDADGDGKGDLCDWGADADGDGIFDEADNCLLKRNPRQEDRDAALAAGADGLGDACDPDDDGDGFADADDFCRYVPTPANTACAPADDADNDGVTAADDNCPAKANPNQANFDGDARGDGCDGDDDGDGVLDAADLCDVTASPANADGDGDGRGDACDPADRDGDGWLDGLDSCPTKANADQADYDGDGLGNSCDTDYDGDGVPNAADNCLWRHNPGQQDRWGDARGDACEILR